MMTGLGDWTCWRVVFRAESPIHIGWHDLGLIQRTRYYIPARSIWGAMVGGLAPNLFGERKGETIYREAQDHVARLLRISYFFLAPGPACDPLRPRYGDYGLRYGDLTPGQFEREYIGSQTSTALEAERLSAEIGALHEFEFIASFGPDGNPLYLIGYIFVRGASAPEEVWKAMAHCAVGADRRYGWGRLTLDGVPTLVDEAFGFAVSTGDQGQLRLTSGADRGWFLPAHLRCEHSTFDFEGDLEAVAGRDWAVGQAGRGGSGQNVTRAQLCWAPGSRPKVRGVRCFGIEPDGPGSKPGCEGFWKLIP